MSSPLPPRIRRYLREQQISCKPGTLLGYKTILSRFCAELKTLSPKNTIASLSPEALEDYRLRLCERPLTPYSKVNYLLALKKYIAWEVERGKLSEDLLTVLDRSKFPTVPEYLPRPLSAENDQKLETLLKQSQNPLSPLFLLLRQTGLRISELIQLPKECVLSDHKNEKYLKVPLGKMNTERLVPLSDASLKLIGQIRNMPPATIASKDLDRLIPMAGTVAQIYPKLAHQFRQITGHMMDQNKPVTFHRLRHTYATSLLTGGVSLPSLMKLLGHRRIEMTLRYAKVTPTHLRNEYMRAISVLEAQSSLTQTKIQQEKTAPLDPQEMIRKLAAYLSHQTVLSPKPKKNILSRLARLEKDLAQIQYTQKPTTLSKE